MAVEAKQETLGFQTEVKQLLHLMIHSLYSNKEIFLRELVSNASDAADKLRFEALQNDSLYEDDSALKIKVEFNKDLKTITVIDNGIGMSREEVIEHLGTIAKSGTRQFFEALTGDQTKDSQLIGQFGVGFYSCFIVAKKVEVFTRRAGLAGSEGVHWSSEGENDYSIETVERARRGTKVVLHLREDMDEFLNDYSLKGIISKYSDHISLPIIMDKEVEIKDEENDGDKKEDEKKEPEFETVEETVNSATALWARNKKDIKDEEYNEFYKHVAHDFEDPMAHIHNKVEGKLEYTSLLYVPSRAPFDLWDREQRHGVKLYVRRVFIMDDADQLIPSWLRFVRGVVDSDDLPLNVSREILQHNKVIDSIRSGCTKKVLSLLKTMAEKDHDKYAEFWKIFGKVLKEGVIDAPEYKDDLSSLFRFASTHEDIEEQKVSLKDYAERMQEGQKAIYYVTADSYATAKNSPHLEIFRKKGIEVLLLIDPIDEWVTTHLTEYDGKPLQSVNKGELDLGEIKTEDEQEEDRDNGDFDKLAKRIKEILGEKVKDVRTTSRLTSSPACLVSDDNDMGRHLEQILKASGQSLPDSKPILEINPEHLLLERLNLEADEDRFADWSHILFDQALLSEGGQLEDPAGFVHRLNDVFAMLGDNSKN
ncbi:MAG: molecular chaperone HtpG [Proteobacteria bacterium]|nr:molecular chaperone HtpG [Pseudomonadota bacterium]NOG59730.1 molecular chaperone HtpG [Pseudomonadota bacterium]